MNMVMPKISFRKKHKVNSLKYHSPVPGGLENELVTLDANGLPAKNSGVQIGDIVGGLIPQGDWAASTNTPTLVNGTGTPGNFYRASDAGTVDFGAGNITFAAGDYVLYTSGLIWIKQDNTQDIHALGGALHSADTLANLNSKVSDATLVDESTVTEPKQAIGYYVSDDRGTTQALGADGSKNNAYNDCDEAIAKGIANGDESIILMVDTRKTASYTANIPAGKTVTLIGSEPVFSSFADVTIVVGNLSTVSIDNLWASKIKEASGITTANIILEECVPSKITDFAETGFATNLDGKFSNVWVLNPTVMSEINGMNEQHGTGLDVITGNLITFKGINVNNQQIADMADGTASNHGMTFGQKYTDSEAQSSVQYQSDVSLAGVAPVDADVSAWSDGDRGHGIGTGGREFYMVKRGTAVKYMEMS